MPGTIDPKFYLKLSVDERLKLVDEIMDSVLSDPSGSEPRTTTWEEAQRRLQEFRADPSDSMSWEEVCAKLGWTP